MNRPQKSCFHHSVGRLPEAKKVQVSLKNNSHGKENYFRNILSESFHEKGMPPLSHHRNFQGLSSLKILKINIDLVTNFIFPHVDASASFFNPSWSQIARHNSFLNIFLSIRVQLTIFSSGH